ncbi:MAG: 2-dehydropantoate 2-reductase [Verrucomicrobiota bacterium]
MNGSEWTPRVAVVGSGAVGGYYGAKLVQHGTEVHFLLRSDLDHVRVNGLKVKSVRGDFHLESVHAAGNTEEIGACDLVIIALKATANESLKEHLPPLLDDGTILLTLQNGLGNEEFLAANFGGERVIGGLCFTCINKTQPGLIEHLGQGRVSIGEISGRPLERTCAVRDLFVRSDVQCETKEHFLRERWKKLVWNIPFNGLSIIGGGIDVGKVLADDKLHQRARALMQETMGAAAAQGFEFSPGLVDQQVEVTLAMKDYLPSSLIDFLAGRDVEVGAIWGEPLRRAKEAGAEVPELEKLHDELTALCVKR